MRFESMQEFLTLVEARSYWAASDKLFISQATLSRHIKEMEYELGAPLFNRTTRKIELTEFGMLLLPYARRAVRLQEEYTEAFASRLEIKKNTLTIGAMLGWNQSKISDIMAEFQQKNPEIRINLLNNESDHLLFMIKNGFCDFAFIRERSTSIDDGLSRRLQYKDALMAYLPYNHPLAQKETLTLTELRNESFLMSDDASLSCLVGTQACRDAGFEPDILFKGNREQTLNYLGKGLGVGLMFGIPKTPTLSNEIVDIMVDPPIYAYVNLVFQEGADSEMSGVKKRFLNFAMSHDFFEESDTGII